jgi:hypothetical protein
MAGKQAESTMAPPLAGQSSSAAGGPSFLPSRLRPATEKLPHPTSRGNADRRDRLPAALSAGIASLTGVDLAATKVYRNSPEPSKYNAMAFASKGSIHLAAGQEKHLPHEAWHLAQQAQNRVKADSRLGNVALNTNPGLENEADRMGPAALKLGLSAAAGPSSPAGRPPSAGSPSLMQRVVFTRAKVGAAVKEIQVFGAKKDHVGLLAALSAKYSESVLLDLISTLFGLGHKQEASYLAKILDSELTDQELSSLMGANYQLDKETDQYLLPGVQATAEEKLNSQLHDGGLGDDTGDVDQQTAALLDNDPDPLAKGTVTQMKRSPGKDTGPKYYYNSKNKYLDGIGYTTDEKGSIDFNKPWQEERGAKAPNLFKSNVAGSTVDLSDGVKNDMIPTQKGGKVHIKNATRAQHFAVANKLHFKKATASHKGLTWHHLTKKYELVLVDATVHAKHGHNGGFLLWK